MSTEIGVLKNSGSRDVDLSLTRFYGGKEKGVCVQLTALMEEGGHGYIQLSVSDLLLLIPFLKKNIIDYEMESKKEEYNLMIDKYKELKKTIIMDMRDLSEWTIQSCTFNLINSMIYGTREIEPVD